MDTYCLVRQALFLLDPEIAHNLTLEALPKFHQFGLLTPFLSPPKNCPRIVMGLQFPNPVGLAAGLDKNGTCIEALAALGFGFIEIGTVTPRPQLGQPTPRLFRLPAASALINRMGFNNQGVESLVTRLRAIKYSGIIGVNIGKNRDTPLEQATADYLCCLRAIYEHAGYVAINLSSPNTPGLRDLQDIERLSRLLGDLKAEQARLAVEKGRHVPLVLKIAPDLSLRALEDIAQVLINEGIEGVIATNTTVDRTAVSHLTHGSEIGGLSGEPLRERSTAVIAALHGYLGDRIPIIGVGGILTGKDALSKQAAGASLVQIYTGFIYRGPALIVEVANALCA